MEASVILIFLTLPGALAGPFQWQAGKKEMCGTTCSDPQMFKYRVGTTYEYRYEAETRTTMAGASEDTAVIRIDANALVEVLGPCTMSLRLTDVSIRRSHEVTTARMVGADDMTHARRALEDRLLKFSFQDGMVGYLCPDVREELWALNIKRGVLTTFQHSLPISDHEKHVEEVDVAGHCPTHYKVTNKGWKSFAVTKVKDLLACTDRYGYRTSLMSTPYNSLFGIKSLPLMKSSHECFHEISTEGYLLSSSCHEAHVFRPFSKAASGASTEVSQKLTFQKETDGVSQASGVETRQTTLLYEHQLSQSVVDSNVDIVTNKLEEICTITAVDIRPQVPQLFGELVHLMRSLDYSDLQNLNRQLLNGNICPDRADIGRKFFMDALPVAATRAALNIMSEFLISGEIKELQRKFWMASLAFIPEPTKDMVAAVQGLIASPTTKMEAMLPVSALVNNYCENNPQCKNDVEVTQVLGTLTSLLGFRCEIGSSKFQEALLTLRAIGNIGRREQITLNLESCFSRSDLPMDLRIAAIDAYRRLPCSADRNNLLQLFLRQNEDSELRIAAYLASMKCPTDIVIKSVQQALLEEKVNQVGSFVWTHLTNLLETNSPHKQALRDVLENDLLQKEFSLDKRKYSRNYEWSFFSDKFNLGGMYESNVVWSPSSFIPRSAMINLTVDVFGHSMNLLEVGGRVQGLQYLLDSYFGPSSRDSGEAWGFGNTKIVKDEKLIASKQKFGDIKEEMRAQVYLRIFGNELAYKMIDSSDVAKWRGEGKNKKPFFDELLEKLAKNEPIAITQSATFIDSIVVIPTGIGLPLNLTVNGSAAIELKASGKLDFSKMNSKTKAFEIVADIQPSGAVEFVSVMSVDAFVTKVGLKMTSRLHTSTAIKGLVELQRGQLFKMDLDTPRDTMEIFNFQSKFFIVHDDSEKEQSMVTANRKEKMACTGIPLADLIGMELCTKLSYPNATLDTEAPYFPFTGPASVAVTLRKHDIHTGYTILAKQIQTDTTSMAQVAFDTPGSKIDRAVSLSYVLSIKDKTFEAELLSPWKKATLKLSSEISEKMYQAKGTLNIQPDKNYTIVAELLKNVRNKGGLTAKYTPSLVIMTPKGQALSFTGSIDYKEDKVLNTEINLEMKDVLKKPISVNAALTMDEHKGKKRYRNNIKILSEFISLKSVSNIIVDIASEQKRSSLLSWRTRLDYSLYMLPKFKPNQVTFSLKVNNRSTSALQKYTVNLNLDSKNTPEINLLLDADLSHKDTHTEFEIKTKQGAAVKDKTKETVIVGKLTHKIKSSECLISFDIKAVHPDKEIYDYQVTGKLEANTDMAEHYLSIRYGKGKSVDAHARIARTKNQHSATFDVTYPGRDIKLNADLIEKDKNQYVFTTMVQPQKGEKNSLVVSYNKLSSDSFEITSELGLYNRLPIKLDVSGNYVLRGMRLQGTLSYENKIYSLEITSDIQPELYGTWTIHFVHPDRRIVGHLEGGLDNNRSVRKAIFDVKWDADYDPSQRVGFGVEIAFRNRPGDLHLGGMVEFFTPVQNYHHIKVQLELENSTRKIAVISGVVLGEDTKEFSTKFELKLPIAQENFGLVIALKTPYDPIRKIALDTSHVFSKSGQLSTLLRGDYNDDYVSMKLIGASKGDLVRRVYEGTADFSTTLLDSQNYKLTFLHNDNRNKFLSQVVLDANGDQYTVTLDATYVKVHVQITTDGRLVLRIPQRSYPLELSWKHKNTLQELNTTLIVQLEPDQKIKLDVGASANLILYKYEADVEVRGPWKESYKEGMLHLNFRYQDNNPQKFMSAALNFDGNTCTLTHTYLQTNAKLSMETVVTYSDIDHHHFRHLLDFQHKSFPMVGSSKLFIDMTKAITIDFQVENPAENSYKTNTKIDLDFLLRELNLPVENVIVRGSHKKERDNWISTVNVRFNKSQTITIDTSMDLSNYKQMKISVDTPFEEPKAIYFDYDHKGDIKRNFTGKYNVKIFPLFDTISVEFSFSNSSIMFSRLRVDTPFEEIRYFEVNSNSRKEGNKQRCYLQLDHFPSRIYTIDTIFSLDFPEDVNVTVNLTTPFKELPSFYTEFGFQYTDDDVNGNFKLIGPSTDFEEFATNFGHHRERQQATTRFGAMISPQKKVSGVANFNWENEIDGTINFDSTVEGLQPAQLILSHRGHSWEDFHTKAGFRMNGDRLESELAYSNKDGNSGLFMLATPDPDIDFFKLTFFQRLTGEDFEGRWSSQYGETSKPFEAGIKLQSTETLSFSDYLKTPYTEDFEMEFSYEPGNNKEAKLLGKYGEDNKVSALLKYKVRENFWDVGSEFEYKIEGTGQELGLTFNRDGPLNNLKVRATGAFMGKRVEVDTEYKDLGKKIGIANVRSNFQGFTNLGASFEYSGNADQFQTKLKLRCMDHKEAEATLDFQRSKTRVVMTCMMKLPLAEYSENKIIYKHTHNKDRYTAETLLTLGSASPIRGVIEFTDNSKVSVVITGPFKDFSSFRLSGTMNKSTMSYDGDAVLTLMSQNQPLLANFMVKAATWPILVNVKAQTPFEKWESVELAITHDGVLDDFTCMAVLRADAIGTVTNELKWKLITEYSFDGLWSLSTGAKGIRGAENLKLAVRNSKVRDEYVSHVEIGWDLLKQIILDSGLKLKDESSNEYRGRLSMTTPFSDVSQLGLSFGHDNNDIQLKDTVMVSFNDKTYLDVDFEYSSDERRLSTLEFREPKPMAFLIGGKFDDDEIEGELKLNWDKTSPEMNVHITGEYTDHSDEMGMDQAVKLWIIHPSRTMGVEHILKQAIKEFQNYFFLTWDKTAGSKILCDLKWSDRSSHYSSAYDMAVRVGVPFRTVQLDGSFSDMGRVQGARGTLMWDADQDKNMKIGVSGELDSRGNTNKVQLDLDLPFVEKEYSLMTETTFNTGNTLLDTRTEFSYSSDPSKTVVLTTRVDDVSFGRDATNYSLAFGVVHPVTDVNIQMTSHVGSSETLSSIGTKIVYMTTAKEKKNLELKGEIDKLRKRMEVELRSPIKNIALEGQMQKSSVYNLNLMSREDNTRSPITSITINPDLNTCDFKFYYDKDAPDNTLNINGRLVNNGLIQTDVYRLSGGQRTSEVLMTIKLNSSHILHTRINWQPSMFHDLQVFLSTRLTVFSYASSEAFRSVAEVIGQEIKTKYEVIMKEIREDTGPLLMQFQKELSNFEKQLDSMYAEVRRFHSRNGLNIRDMGQLVTDGFTLLEANMKNAVLIYRQFHTNLQQQIASAMQRMGKYPLAQKYAQLVEDFAGGLKNLRTTLEQALDHLSVEVMAFSDQSYKQYLQISRQIERKLQTYTAVLQQNSYYQSLSGAYHSAQSRLMQLSHADYKQLAEAANQQMLEVLDRLGLKETYEQLIGKTKQLLDDQFSDIIQRPEIQQLYIIGNEIYQQSIWAYHYWQTEKNLHLAVAQLFELLKDITLLEITRIKNAVVDLDKSRVIVFDLQTGEIQFEIYLPVPLKSLTEPPDMRLTKYVNRVKSWVSTYVPNYRHSVWTSINDYIPSMDSSTWLPPFTAHGYVMADKYIVTFDRSHYNFAGRCSYILARDMADDRFIVVMNYNNVPRQAQVESVVVMLRGMAIEIMNDNKVKVNEQKTELPFISGQISAVRQKSVVRVSDWNDLVVEVDMARGIYSVAVSGWYHGRTAGLLGSYDNEQHNDMTSADRKITTDIDELANSWDVGRSVCRSRNLAENGALDRNLPSVQACEKFLNDSSSYFGPCFGQVVAGELVRVCADYVKNGLEQQDAQCKAGQQYRYMCQHKGVYLGTPPDCVTCQFPAHKTMVAEESTDWNGVRSVDVVFIIEENACNAWAKMFLSRLATELGLALTSKGMRANRFGLVSYLGNGSNDQQYTHTIEGEVFGDPSNFLKATENLRLNYIGSSANPSMALQLAMTYPFRVGVIKMLVLLPCGMCGNEVLNLKEVIQSHGFLLHVLNNQELKVSVSSNSSPARIYGLDKYTVHTKKSATDKDAIFQQLETPSEGCAVLALNTNGSVFDATHMLERETIRRDFLQTFAARGASNALPAECQICTCHDDGMGQGHVVCKLCSSNSPWIWNDIPNWLSSSSTSIMGVINDVHHRITSALNIQASEMAAAA